MEPMRPVDYTEHPNAAFEKRKQRRWRMFFGMLVLSQLIVLTIFGAEFWWVVLVCAAVFGLYELLWSVLDRAKSYES
ncbi:MULTISPECIES: hypothetical protein [Rhodococcus]|uniref:Transmembrane protein n=1 Tax=Rhodococcus cercidiphylli TaxID=489916 RepID=A0ABU4B180_9NOCA|nr:MULTISPECIES: hypothetical protein [Rhodococcus]MDV6232257.1 hypothetical protein [Rhodococcus cercidiphylli]MDV8056586.1 hypothetical protein [Rhodococcus sp. IEGM 1343]